ncbi:hypothetical protein [Guptibacillus algicola]|nr:hypothetical protein [Alkalihalobacillus algicola]
MKKRKEKGFLKDFAEYTFFEVLANIIMLIPRMIIRLFNTV